MTAGKAASQAGHAFLDSFILAEPEHARAYLAHGGTKVVLSVPDEAALRALFMRARAAKLPCAMVVEQGHVMPPHFDGAPIVTAIGIGPCRRGDARSITRGLKLMS